MVKLLLEHGADVNIRNRSGATALAYAATFGQTQAVELLLAAGADKSIQDVNGKTAHAHAKEKGFNELAALLA